MSGTVRKLHKRLQVKALADVFTENKVVIVTHTSAMDVSAFNGLKRTCQELGVQTCMSKNTLAKRAIQDTRYRTLSPLFEGPTQLFYANDTEAVAKFMQKIADPGKDPSPSDPRNHLIVLGAVVEDTVYSPADLERISKLPPLPELHAQILGQIQGPSSLLMSRLSQTPMALTQLLHRHAHPEEAEAAAEAAAAAVAAGGGADAADIAPAAEDKTHFEIKLDAFDAAMKIKLIKEVRGVLPDLGLKEAKGLVESSPVVIKEGATKEEADEIKAKLEAVGGKILLE